MPRSLFISSLVLFFTLSVARADWFRTLNNPFFNPPHEVVITETLQIQFSSNERDRWKENIAENVRAIALSGSSNGVFWKDQVLISGDQFSINVDGEAVDFRLVSVSPYLLKVEKRMPDPLLPESDGSVFLSIALDPFFAP